MTAETKNFSLYIGNKSGAVAPYALWGINNSKELLHAVAETNNVSTSLQHLIDQRQTHSATGYALASQEDILRFQPYLFDGDYLITNQPHIGLGVTTADCMPVFLYDTQNHAIAMIHAGWRGAHQRIACGALEHMQKIFNTSPDFIQVIIGPCARACCYEVTPDFIKNIPEPYCFQKNDMRFCDLVAFQVQQLINAGISRNSIDISHATCTICNLEYCSYRREGNKALRQLTIASLK